MTAPTVAVTVKVYQADGTPSVGTVVTARLDKNEVYQGFIVASEVSATTDATGAAVLRVFPNHPTTGLGTQGSVWVFRATPADGRALHATAQVPNNDCTLDAIADLDPAPSLTSAQAAQASAAASAGAAGSSATDAANSATAASTSASDAASSATAAAGSATAASTSATNAANSASAAATSATNASSSASNAATSATNAANSATAAATSKTQADASATTAQNAATAAAQSESNAADSAASAASSAGSIGSSVTAAATSAGNASTSATNAANSATAAANSATAAHTSELNASASASAAATSASQANSSATTASVSASTATTAASNASTSAAQAAASATQSVNAQVAAQAAANIVTTTADNSQLAIQSALTATAQASLASIYALSAASAAQQDLSGVTAAALHRGPGAVVAMCIDDPRTWSDGGACLQKFDHLSWMNEPLQGAWIPSPGVNGIQSEIVARALGGTLGSNQVTNGNFANGTTGWVSSTGTPSIDSNGHLRVTNPVGTGYGTVTTSTPIPTVVGQTYLVTFDSYGAVGTGGSAVASAGSGVSGPARSSYLAPNSAPNAFVFVATSTTLYLDLYTNGNLAGGYTTWGNVQVRPVTAFAPSGSYCQDATDGKFKRLWKNLLKYSEDLTQAAWTKNSIALTAGIADPNGGTAAFRLTATANNAYAYQSFTAPGNLQGVNSIMVRRVSGTGTVGLTAPDGTTTNITASLSGTWQRFTSTPTNPNGGTSWFGPQISLGTAGDVVEVAFPQAQLGSSFDSYEQKLTGDNGWSEGFRGNVAKYGRTAWIAEASRVVGYAIDQPGRPAWISFPTSGALSVGTVTNISCGNPQYGASSGVVIVTGSAGVAEIDIPKDELRVRTTSGIKTQRFLSTRLTAAFGPVTSLPVNLPSNTVNAAGACVMPDAPCDPVTGLQVPTIAVTSGGGCSIVHNDGTVVNWSQGSAIQGGIVLTPYVLMFANASGTYEYYATKPGSLGASFGTTQIAGGSAPDFNQQNASRAMAGGGRADFGRIAYGNGLFQRLRLNESAFGASLAAAIANDHNTGWMAGDIRRCYLSDTAVGAVSGTELVTNGDFTSDTSGWTASNCTIASVGGQLQLTTGGAFNQQVTEIIPTVVGQTYALVGTMHKGTCTNTISVTTDSTGAPLATCTTTSPTSFAVTFTASSATTKVILQIGNNETGTTAFFDAISVKACSADRSYKASRLIAHGTLTRSQVGVGSQLVAYSGFSAANYLQEPAYSADLDPGTGTLYAPVYMTIPTNVSAAAWAFDRSGSAGAFYRLGCDATGHLVGVASDGTTTRTVTTTAAYNTGTRIRAALRYTTDGTLAIIVGDTVVASTTGTPLGSLNNASALLTVGIDYGLTAPWPGDLALLHIGMTAPSADAEKFIYAQEREMFRDGAQVCLPDSGSLVDLDYDAVQDKWKVASAANESSVVGLVVTAQAPVSAGSFTHVVHKGGIKLLSRSTTNPGVDITIPALNAIEQMNRRAEDAARLSRDRRVFSFDATTGQTDFALPLGWESAVDDLEFGGVGKRYGSTKDYVTLFDGFRETVRANVAPGNGVWVKVPARRNGQ